MLNRKSLFFVAVLVVYYLTRDRGLPHLEHLLQAYSWTHGRFDIDLYAATIWEKVAWRDHWYQVHPPLSAGIMLLAILVHLAHPTLIAIILGALAATLVYVITDSLWLAVFFAFGTDVWFEATLGNPWGFCLVLSCVPTLLALHSRKSFWVGIWAGIAALARYDLVMAWPVYLLHTKQRSVLYGMMLALSLYVGYAYLRFGTWNDIALWEWWRIDMSSRVIESGLTADIQQQITAGPFSLRYLPLNLYTALYLAPSLSLTFPWIHPTQVGQSLLTTSPALLTALRAPLRERAVGLLWLAIIAVMSGALCVWSNGVAQFGARYWIQALPFFLCLMPPPDQMGKILILASVAANGFALWHIRVLGWG
jgi:hypothetical protein